MALPKLSVNEEIRFLEERLKFLRIQQKEAKNEDELQFSKNTNKTSTSEESKISEQSQPQHSNAGSSTSKDAKRDFRKIHISSDIFKTYKKRKGYANPQYEILMCALYALKLTMSDQVRNFEMTTHNVECGDFNNMELKVTFEKNETCSFLFHLKHREATRNITEEMLTQEHMTRKKKTFYLLDYINSIIKSDISNVNYVLYTNAPCDLKDGTQLFFESHVPLTVKRRVDLKYADLLTNVLTTKRLSIFQFTPENTNSELYEKCKKFYLFADQDKIKLVKLAGQEILRAWLTVDIYNAFQDFMRTWWSGNFCLTKHDVIAKLTELSLSPYIRALTGKKHNEKSELLAQAIIELDITIVNNNDTVADIWAVSEENHDMGKVKRKFGINSKELTQTEKSKVLWYLEKVPLVITVNDSNIATVGKAMTLIRKGAQNKKLVLIGYPNKTDFAEMKIFESFADLANHNETIELYYKIESEFMVCLQGRRCISLRELIAIDDEIAQIIKITELLQMTQNEYLLGIRQEISELNISRKLAVTIVDTAKLLDNDIFRKKHIIIINCGQDFQKMLLLKNIKFMEVPQYINDAQINDNLVLLSIIGECTKNQFDKVRKKSGNSRMCLFQVFDNESLILLRKTEDASIPSNSEKVKFLEEEKILEFLRNTLNAIFAPPSMGKSVLLKTMSSKYCPPHIWSVYVNLITLNPFLRKNPNNDAILNQILKVDNEDLITKLQRFFYETKQLIIFLDGLNEVDPASVDILLDFIEYLYSEGIPIWLSSRENLRVKIAQKLDVVPLEIAELDKQQQEIYMHTRLEDRYNSEDRAKIVTSLFNSADVAHCQKLLGIPLQLYMTTQIFIDSGRSYEDLNKENAFILTKLYEIYFEGKKTGIPEDFWPQYTVLGLKTYLDVSAFEELDVDLGQVEELMIKIKKEGDKLGIIREITEDNQIVFTHQTYAEYLACVWLTAHLERVSLLRDDIMFSDRCQNLKLMFDIMMAEENPLHLSIICRNMEQFEKNISDADKKDKAGRNALQLACSYGRKYRHKMDDINKIRSYVSRDSKEYMQVIDVLLKETVNTSQTDILFGYDCVKYALASGCLYPLEKFLETGKVISKNFGETLCAHFDAETMVAYCVHLGYTQLMSILLQDNRVDVYSETFSACGLLGLAVKEKQIDIVKVLIKNGIDINWIYDDYLDEASSMEPVASNILEYACLHEAYEVIRVLMEYGAYGTNSNSILHYFTTFGTLNEEVIDIAEQFNININCCNKKKQTPLHIACKTSSLENMKTLLSKGANVNVVDDEDKSPLQYAVTSWDNRKERIDLLISHGLNVNATNKKGQTPLHIVCEYGSLENVKKLLEKDPTVDILDNSGNNSLHYAVSAHYHVKEKIDLLLNCGLNVNAQNKKGQTPLHIACKYGLVEHVKKLLEKGCNIDVLDNNGRSLLHYAGTNKNKKVVDLLLKYGVDVNCKDNEGQTPLHIACRFGSLRNVMYLLEKGSDVNILDIHGRSPLHHVLFSQHYIEEKINLLLSYAVNLNTQDKKGQTPLHLACKFGNISNVKHLLTRGADSSVTTFLNRNLLHYAAASCNVEMIKFIFSLGFNVNTGDKHNTTPLHIACKYRNFQTSYEIAKLLQENGSDFKAVDDGKRNILHYVVESEDPSFRLIQYLTDHVDVRAQDSEGRNALDYAMEKENSRVIKCLIETDAFSDYFNRNSETFLYWSIYSGSSHRVNWVIEKQLDFDGINVNHANFPLYFAKSDGHLQPRILIKMTEFIHHLLQHTRCSHKEIVIYLKDLSTFKYTMYSIFVAADDKDEMKKRIDNFENFLKRNRINKHSHIEDDW